MYKYIHTLFQSCVWYARSIKKKKLIQARKYIGDLGPWMTSRPVNVSLATFRAELLLLLLMPIGTRILSGVETIFPKSKDIVGPTREDPGRVCGLPLGTVRHALVLPGGVEKRGVFTIVIVVVASVSAVIGALAFPATVLVDPVQALVPPGLVKRLGPRQTGQASALVEAVHALELPNVLADYPAGLGVLDVVLALTPSQVFFPLGSTLNRVRALGVRPGAQRVAIVVGLDLFSRNPLVQDRLRDLKVSQTLHLELAAAALALSSSVLLFLDDFSVESRGTE